jgi:hypothetical protein
MGSMTGRARGRAGGGRPRLCRAAALAAVGATASLAPAAYAAPTTVLSFPSPDTRTASPHTEISFRGITAEGLRGLVVTASRSGRHRGALKDHADGHGVSFVPGRPFRSGERVRVRVPGGVRVDGGDGRIDEFTTARIAGRFATEGPSGAPRGQGPFAALKSRPDLAPPTVQVLQSRPGREPGSIFLAPKQGTGQGGPLIVDDAGTPIWFLPLGAGIRATDFRVQSYAGRPALTWWQGAARGGSGRGEGIIADSAYRIVKRVRAGNGYAADLHEFRLTGRGTALVLAYAPVRRDLSAVGGPRHGIAVDGIAQEVELATGRVRFEWHSLGNVALTDTDLPRPTSARDPFDYFHINSFNLDADGGYVVSGRRVDTVYKLDPAGRIEWRLGGKSGTLARGPGVRFNLQHDAVPHGYGTYTIFDNSAKGVRKGSRAITVRVDAAQHTATLVRAIHHPDWVLAATQGDLQVLPGGNTLVGWGSQGRISEFGPAGDLLFDLELPRGYDTYRAYRFAWDGQPPSRPRAAATASGPSTAVFASWNGSTRTASWTVLAGASPGALAPVVSAPRTGLETPISAPTSARYVAVEAVDASGRALSRSAVVKVAGR